MGHIARHALGHCQDVLVLSDLCCNQTTLHDDLSVPDAGEGLLHTFVFMFFKRINNERIQAFETKRMKKLLHISYLELKTNDWVWSKINFLMSPQEIRLATVKRWKLAWFGHVTCHDSLSKTILQGTLEVG